MHFQQVAWPCYLSYCSDRRSVGLLTMRKLISSGSPYEPKVGISRAARVGNVIADSGTAPLGSDGRTVGIEDVRAQARRCLEIIAVAFDDEPTA